MTLHRTLAGVGAIALVLALAACAGPPWTLARSPEAIALRWYPDELGGSAAAQMAELHCRSWGKAAALAGDDRDGSAEIATYRCR
ncbi:MAG: hypothetical protein ACREFH_07205 [Stellaceae bacterium]